MTRYNIFLAGAKALDPMREICRSITNRLNNLYPDFEIVTVDYKDFPSQLKAGGTQQADYDEHIANESNIVIFLLDSRLGDITKEEFYLAWNALQNKKFPHIYVFSRLGDGDSIADINAIREKVDKSKQYYIEYADDKDFTFLLYHQLNMFMLKKPAEKLTEILYTEQESFTYRKITEANQQTYRTDDTSFYHERSVDREKATRNIICFSGAPMSGKSKAMVRFAKRLFVRLSEENKDKNSKTQLLVITPRVSERKLSYAIEHLQNLNDLESSASHVNTIVLIDDFDSKLYRYQDKKRSLVNTCIRRTLLSPDNYLLITQKSKKGFFKCEDEAGKSDSTPVEDRIIAPLTDDEWRNYCLELKAAGYNDVDAVNRHVIGALFDKHDKKQLTEKLRQIVVEADTNDDSTVDVLQMANEIYELSLPRTTNSIKIIDLAYLHWYHEWLLTQDNSRNSQEHLEEIIQICRKVANTLVANQFLLDIDERRIYIDEYLVSSIFPSMTCDEALQDLDKFIHFRFSQRFTSENGKKKFLYHHSNSVPRVANIFKWKHRLLVSVEHLNNSPQAELAEFARTLTTPPTKDIPPETLYLSLAKKSLDDGEEKGAKFDKRKTLSWAYRLTADYIRYAPTLDEAMAWRCNLKKWVDENLVDKGAFWIVDVALMSMDGFTHAEFDKIKNDFLSGETTTLVADYGEISSKFISQISRFLDIQTLLMIANGMLESGMLSQDCTTKTESGGEDEDDYDYYDEYNEDDYNDEDDEDTTSIAEAEDSGNIKTFDVKVMKEILFNSILQNATKHEDVSSAWEFGTKLYDGTVLGRLQHVRLYTWKSLTVNLTPNEVKRIALWLMSIDCGENEIMLYIRQLGINVCLTCLSENDVLYLSNNLQGNIDNYTCTSVMKHLTFESAMSFFINSFLPAVKQRDERNPDRPQYKISIEVFNVLMKKTATKSDYHSVLGFMHKAGYSIAQDVYSLGIALDRDFLPASEKVQLIKAFKAEHPSMSKLNVKTISGLIKSRDYKFADLFKILFEQDSEERYGLNHEEQVALCESEYIVSLLIEKANSRENYDLVMSSLGDKAKLLICHPDGNIVSKMLKNDRVFKSYDERMAYLEEVDRQYPEYQRNVYAVNTLLGFLRNAYYELKDHERQEQKNELIAKANNFIQQTIRHNGIPLKDIFYSRVGICESCDEIQDFVNDNGDIIQSTPYEQFVKHIFQTQPFWKNIPGFIIYEVLYYKRNVEDRDGKLDEILRLAEQHGIQFSYEDISKIDNAAYKAGIWTQELSDRLHSLCHYKDLLKSMIAFLTCKDKDKRWTWKDTEDEIDYYNNNIATNGHEKIRTVTYWNAVLKNIGLCKRTKEDLDKAKSIFDELRTKQWATNQTYASYCKMITSPRNICQYIDEISNDNQDCILHLVSNAIIKCKTFDEVLDILEDYNYKIAEYTTYLINGIIEKFLQDEPDYLDDLIYDLADPDTSLCETLIYICNDDNLPDDELKKKAGHCHPNSSTFTMLFPRLSKAEQFDRIIKAMHQQSIRIDNDFAKKIIEHKDKVHIWESGFMTALSKEMVRIQNSELYEKIRKIMTAQ